MGNALGEVEIDLEKDELAWGEYMSAQVNLDVSKPLL